MLTYILIGVGVFTGFDYLLKKYNFEGRYYFNHAVCNSIVVYNTINSMLLSYNINTLNNIISTHHINNSKIIIYSLHIYHFLYYFNKLRRDDYLHHILMIGVVLPLTEIVPQTNIIAHGLFFTTGFPGLIDYILLFFNRNKLINRNIEKRVNTFLNLWIRAPGCIMNSCMSIMYIINNYNLLSKYQINGGLIIAGLIYWNGIYFMNQVIVDNYKINHINYINL